MRRHTANGVQCFSDEPVSQPDVISGIDTGISVQIRDGYIVKISSRIKRIVCRIPKRIRAVKECAIPKNSVFAHIKETGRHAVAENHPESVVFRFCLSHFYRKRDRKFMCDAGQIPTQTQIVPAG